MEDPPPYSRHASTTSTTRPQGFTPFLLDTSRVKAYLSLLNAFKALRSQVEDLPVDRLLTHNPVAAQLGKEERWSWVVGLAVERFQRWLESITSYERDRSVTGAAWVEDNIPPIDVIMVWHAYLLNPIWYAEDCSRIELLSPITPSDRFLYIMTKLGDLSTYTPSDERCEAWENQTRTPFDPIAALEMEDPGHTLACSFCEHKLNTPLLTSENTGYLQSHFSLKCIHCSEVITMNSLGLAKFIRDMERDHHSAADKRVYGRGVYLAGTVHTMYEECDEEGAGSVKDVLRRGSASVFHRDTYGTNRKMRRQAMFARIRTLQNLRAAPLDTLRRRAEQKVDRILSTYTNDRPFSVDLTSAVLRQHIFLDQLHKLGWTTPGFFNNPANDSVLQYAITRYHAFLNLAYASSQPPLPTLDIDMVWHAHQLSGSQYMSDCVHFVKYFLDHETTVEDSTLAASFKVTCNAWKERFGVSYTHCGCPIPEDTAPTSFIERLSLLARSYYGKQTLFQGSLEPLQRPDSLLATHISYHVRVTSSSTTSEHRAEDKKLVVVEKMGKEGFLEGNLHEAAFSYPPPTLRLPDVHPVA